MKTKKLLILSTISTLSCLFVCNCAGNHLPEPEPEPEPEPITNPSEKVVMAHNAYEIQSNSIYNMSACPSIGSPKLLIIPVWFTDSDQYITNQEAKDQIHADIGTAYLGTSDEVGWQSVSSYYYNESLGKLNLQGTISDWYESEESSTSLNGAWKTSRMVISATDWYFNEHPEENRTDYDSNGDGWLDGVIVIYAAPDKQTYKDLGNDNLWAYCYWTMNRELNNVENPGPNQYFFASYDFMYADKSLTEYHNGSFPTEDVVLDTHTFIHEMGHVLGINDYYDYSSQYKPAGGFSMQDYNVGGHDAYSLMQFGWADPYVPTETGTYYLSPTATSGDCIVLSNHNDSFDSPYDEYLLIEFYAPLGMNAFDSKQAYQNGYPKGLNSYGVRLWHVDGRLKQYNHGKWSDEYYSDPTIGNVELMACNSYYKKDGSAASHCSPLGIEYGDYNELQLIRKDSDNKKDLSYRPTGMLGGLNLFYGNNSFSMSDDKIKGQFVNEGLSNSQESFGWSFQVEEVNKEDLENPVLKVTVTKESV